MWGTPMSVVDERSIEPGTMDQDLLVQIPVFHAFIDSLQNISGSSSIWQAVCLVLGIQFEQILTLDSHTHGEDKQVIT